MAGKLYIGIGGHVVALDPGSGSELWRTKLKSSPFVTVVAQGDVVLAGAAGELFCLDAATGSIRWHNPLKGLGTGVVSFGNATGAVVAAMMAAQAAAQTAAIVAASG